MLTEKPLHHQVRIVRVPEARVHTNADTLELLDIEGYQVVVKKSQFKAGDLAVYIQPDSVVPQTEPFRFIWEPKAPPEHGIVSGDAVSSLQHRPKIDVSPYVSSVRNGAKACSCR